MRVAATLTTREPTHNVELAQIDSDVKLVAIEQIGNQSSVATSSELVGDELGVLPDAEDIGVDDHGCGVGRGGLGEVGGDTAL